MDGVPGGLGLAAIERCADAWAKLHARIGHRFTRASPSVPAEVKLTDAEWGLVQPLHPPQKTMTGRPRHDHHTVLAGILWVMRSQASWRAMPQEYGKWETAYQRYRLWCASGLWQCIVTALP